MDNQKNRIQCLLEDLEDVSTNITDTIKEMNTLWLTLNELAEDLDYVLAGVQDFNTTLQNLSADLSAKASSNLKQLKKLNHQHLDNDNNDDDDDDDDKEILCARARMRAHVDTYIDANNMLKKALMNVDQD